MRTSDCFGISTLVGAVGEGRFLYMILNGKVWRVDVYGIGMERLNDFLYCHVL